MIAPAGMNNERLALLIRKVATSMLEDQPGFWKFEADETFGHSPKNATTKAKKERTATNPS